MNALTSAEVLALHNIARRDPRLDRVDRVLLAEVARTGHLGSMDNLAKRCGRKSPGDVARRIGKIRDAGFLPAVTA